MTWNERDHPRDGEGQFTHSSVGSWAERVVQQFGIGEVRSNRHHPPGHAAAAREHERLWSIPDTEGRDRTDAEHDEAVRLDDAFEAYRGALGLRRNPEDRSNEYTFTDGKRGLFNEYGERMNRRSSFHGSTSQRRRTETQMRRGGEYRGDAYDREVRRGGKAEQGAFGYGARGDHSRPDGGLEAAVAFVAAMKRIQPRARQDIAREPVRRTPRGTKVSPWMQQVSDNMAKTREGR